MKSPDLGCVFILTADQRGSRTHHDRVPAALAALAPIPVELAFERTAGDEIQGLVARPASVVEAVTALVREGDWRIGIGVGSVEEPLPRSTRAARGLAYIAARAAVEDAGRQPTGLRVIAGGEHGSHYDDLVRDAEGVLWLLTRLLERRTTAGWEACELMNSHETQAQVAAHLGVSGAAINQRLRAAGYAEGEHGKEVCTRALLRLQEAPCRG